MGTRMAIVTALRLCANCLAKSPLLTSNFVVSTGSESLRLISPFPIELMVACWYFTTVSPLSVFQ